MISQKKMVLVWLKSNWRWGALNLFAVFVLIYVLRQGSTGWSNMDTFDSGLESGKWAIRSLLACLTMTPLNTYFGWKAAIKLRKSAGLWAFGFATAHVLLYIREAKLEWLTFSMPLFIAFGLLGMSILSALASTSNRWAMQRLGKNWKRLHRFVYFSGIAVVTHAMLATTMSKKILGRDPEAPKELRVHIAILCVLLVVRIPLVRKLLKQIPVLLKRHRKPDLQVGMPDGGAELWPKVHGRESSVSVKPTFIIANEILIPSELSGLSSPSEGTNGLLQGYDEDLSVNISTEDQGKVQEAVPN
jgi:sulfoxide reductase heme-binding subunit YedZ